MRKSIKKAIIILLCIAMLPLHSVSAAGPTTVQAQIYSYFKKKGLTDAGIAGLMGNIQAESGFRTNAFNGGGGGQGAFGLCQWRAGRQTALRQLAASRGLPATNLGVQLDHLWTELSTGYRSVLAVLQNTNSVYDASKKVLQVYEVPGDRFKQSVINYRAGLSGDLFTLLTGLNPDDFPIEPGPGVPGMPSDVVEILYGGNGRSYGEYNIKNEGALGYNHWQSFNVEEEEDKVWVGPFQLQHTVLYSEMDDETFGDFTNGLRLPSCGLFEDYVEPVDEMSRDTLDSANYSTSGNGGTGVHIPKPDINGAGVVLDMPQYINQASFPNITRYFARDKNGNTFANTVARSGCLDCSVAMAYMYYYGACDANTLLLTKISNHVGADGALNTSYVMDLLGMAQGANVVPQRTNNGKLEGWGSLVSSIDNGNPCIMHVRGIWNYGGQTYHKTTNGHFLLATGYDEEGIYVYDPGRKDNTIHGKPIPWEAWSHAASIMGSDLYFRPLKATRK